MIPNFEQYLSQVQSLQQKQESFVSITIVNSVGSLPQEIGARCLVTAMGLRWGTVGGGKLEAFAVKKAQELLQGQDRTKYLDVNLQTDIGMSCGGKASLFFEIHQFFERWKIVLFGAGHVGQELAAQLLRQDCEITVIDSRPEWLEKLPSGVQKMKASPMENALSEISQKSFVVVATMGHTTDFPILQKALMMNFPYLGCMGSDTKAGKIRRELSATGVSEVQIARLICPIGEDIGNNTPPEIAVSIIAQLLKHRDQKVIS